MSSQMHTPGPWKAHGVMVKNTTDTLGGMFRITMPEEDRFAFCTHEGDRHLIAAAPELIYACELALVELSKMGCECDCENMPTRCPICACRAAIAAATGGKA